MDALANAKFLYPYLNINKEKDHSVFLGFAPMKTPKIAISVYVENGGFGKDFAVPIGALMIEKYLNGQLTPESEEKAKEMSRKKIDYGQEKR